MHVYVCVCVLMYASMRMRMCVRLNTCMCETKWALIRFTSPEWNAECHQKKKKPPKKLRMCVRLSKPGFALFLYFLKTKCKVSQNVFAYVYLCICMYILVGSCVCVCVCVCAWMNTYVVLHMIVLIQTVNKRLRVYVCMNLYVHMYVHVYIYIYICIYIHTFTLVLRPFYTDGHLTSACIRMHKCSYT